MEFISPHSGEKYHLSPRNKPSNVIMKPITAGVNDGSAVRTTSGRNLSSDIMQTVHELIKPARMRRSE